MFIMYPFEGEYTEILKDLNIVRLKLLFFSVYRHLNSYFFSNSLGFSVTSAENDDFRII